MAANETPGGLGEYEPRDYEPIQPGGGRSGSFTERAKKFLGPIAIAVIAFASKAKAILLLLPKIKVLLDLGHDAGLDRGLLADLGLVVRGSASCCSCSSTRWVT